MNQFELEYANIYNQLKPSVEYNQFKQLLIEYAEKIMTSFLNNKANCKCIIKKLEDWKKGEEDFDEDSNTYIITINENVVKKIFSGQNTFDIFVVFHEISHVFDQFNISNKDFKDANLKRICIDNGMMEILPTYDSDFYYIHNYKTISIESHANLLAAKLTRDFFKKCNLEFSDLHLKGLQFIEFFSLQKLHNSSRDIRNMFSDFNDYYLPLNSLLSEMKKTYPEYYESLKQIVGEDILTEKEEFEESEFEKRLYDEYAILELSDIIENPLFRELVDKKTKYRPKI